MTKIIEVKVKPNSKQSKIETNDEGLLIAFVKAQPIDGKANAELISLIAKIGRASCRERVCYAV